MDNHSKNSKSLDNPEASPKKLPLRSSLLETVQHIAPSPKRQPPRQVSQQKYPNSHFQPIYSQPYPKQQPIFPDSAHIHAQSGTQSINPSQPPPFESIHSSHSSISSKNPPINAEPDSYSYSSREIRPQDYPPHHAQQYNNPTSSSHHIAYSSHYDEIPVRDPSSIPQTKPIYTVTSDSVKKPLMPTPDYIHEPNREHAQSRSSHSNLYDKEHPRSTSNPSNYPPSYQNPSYHPHSNPRAYRDSEYEPTADDKVKSMHPSSVDKSSSLLWDSASSRGGKPPPGSNSMAPNPEFVPPDTSGAYHHYPPDQNPSVPHHPDQVAARNSFLENEEYSNGKKINVRDALSYLDLVKIQFQHQPEIYNHFLEIMKDFKSNQIDTPGVIERVSDLFRGYNHLIEGFNTFLPPGYSIEPPDHYYGSVKVISPTGKSKYSNNPEIAPMISPTSEFSHSEAQYPKPAKIYKKQPIARKSPKPTTISQLPLLPQTVPVTNPSDPQFNMQPVFKPDFPKSPTYRHNDSGIVMYPPKQQPMEFNHAINFVNRIKMRFSNDTERYSEFLDILQTYQREAGPIHEIYEKMSTLFADAPDLLAEFKNFLPEDTDASSQQQFTNSQRIHNPNVPEGQYVPPENLDEYSGPNYEPGMGRYPPVGNFTPSIPGDVYNGYTHQPSNFYGQNASTEQPQQKQLYKKKRNSGQGDISSISSHPKRRKEIPDDYPPNDINFSEKYDLGYAKPIPPKEFIFFEKIKNSIGKSPEYFEFIKLLDMYNREVLDENALLEHAYNLIGSNVELFEWFKSFLDSISTSHEPSSTFEYPIESGQDMPVSLQDNISSVKPSDEIELTPVSTRPNLENCRSYGPSYRLLPERETKYKCSGRDIMCNEVLNDEWVSHPTWASEETEFVHHKKNAFEDALFRCEEDRHQMEIEIENNFYLIQALSSTLLKLESLSEEERQKFTLPVGLGTNSEALPRRALRKVYGNQRAAEILNALHSHPYAAIPIILKRLKLKDEEWRKQRREMIQTWRQTDVKNFYKALDHQGPTFKTNDRKMLSAKYLISEIEKLRKKSLEENQDNKPKSTELRHRYQIETNFGDTSLIIDIIKMICVYISKQHSMFINGEKSEILDFINKFFGVFMSLNYDPKFIEIKKWFDSDADVLLEELVLDEKSSDKTSSDDNSETDPKNPEDSSYNTKEVLSQNSTNSNLNSNVSPSGSELEPKAKSETANAEPADESKATYQSSVKPNDASSEIQLKRNLSLPLTKLSKVSSMSWLNNKITPITPMSTTVPTNPISKANSGSNTKSVPSPKSPSLDKKESNSSIHPSNLSANNDVAMEDSKSVETTDDIPDSRVFYCNSSVFVFIRLFETLYSRLETIKQTQKSELYKYRDNNNKTKSTNTLNLAYVPESLMGYDLSTIEYYEVIKRLIIKLLNGQLDSSSFEDSARYLFGIKAYLLLTVDKVISLVTKQLQLIVNEPKCTDLINLFLEMGVTNKSNLREYISYRTKSQNIIGESELVFRFDYLSKLQALTIQLLKQEDSTLDMNLSMEDKWAYYVDSYILYEPTEGIPEAKKIFYIFIQKSKEGSEQSDSLDSKILGTNSLDSTGKSESLNSGEEANAPAEEQGSAPAKGGQSPLPDKPESELSSPSTNAISEYFPIQPYLSRNLKNVSTDEREFVVFCNSELEIKIPVNTYKLCFLTGSQDTYVNASRRSEYKGPDKLKLYEESIKSRNEKWTKFSESHLNKQEK
ncbi:hypothetical protein BB560_001943 [Smittium megazygosporum]|uniref:Histone deacetylase interacting domain-containing protein n=1 Tax=Smittium megazygosporum TaxID=133381 RepID=A0A2T9ZG59_9FUNG|nr:hypothetical protein BB560_001943 [Smittium megazygosporum]